MNVTVGDICRVMDEIAPPYMAEKWDNIGLMIGRREKEVHHLLLALDITPDVINEAIQKKIDMIITHHPIPFKPISHINSDSLIGREILDLAENKIALYTAHTNLDATNGGTADYFANLLELQKQTMLTKLGEEEGTVYGAGKIGYLNKQVTLIELTRQIKNKLQLDYIQYIGDADRKVEKVALCTGSGIDFVEAAIKSSADVYITGDIKYHEALDVINSGLPLINVSHFGTEFPILHTLERKLTKLMPDIRIIKTKVQKDPFNLL